MSVCRLSASGTAEAADQPMGGPIYKQGEVIDLCVGAAEGTVELLVRLWPVTERWRSISSTNVLERLNAEIDRWAKVVGIFPNTAALLRLTTAVLVEQDDEWQDGRRHFSQQSMAQLLADAPALPTTSPLEDLAA